MPVCPRCRCEYNVGVEECIDCHVPLVLYRPRRQPLFDVDADDLLVPAGALFCLLAAVGLLGLRGMAGAGRLDEPLASLILAQPAAFAVFYVIAAVLSGLVIAIALVRWLFFRG
jgi:hypothetical protein